MSHVITLDGPNGVGKTAVGLELSKKLQMHFISLGCIYRGIAWCVLRKYSISEALNILSLKLKHIDSGATLYLPFVNGKILDEELYCDPDLEILCSEIAQHQIVRDFVKQTVQKLSENGLIAEGRSAHKIFPKASCSIFLTASEEERAKRNLAESRRIGMKVDSDQLCNIRKERDTKDKTRVHDPLMFTSKMLIWDSTHTSFSETCEQLFRWIEHHVFKRKLRLSVIIPAYNRENHLRHCLECLQKQTIPQNEYEIIVVDDGSQDRTGAIAAQLGAHVVLQSNRGPGAARNAGLAKASGDIIIFLDADIITPPDYLKNVQERHSMTNALLLLGARRHLPEGVNDFQNTSWRLDSREKLLRRYTFCLSHLKHPWSLAYTCNFSAPKHLMKGLEFDESFVGWGLEDIEFAYQLYMRGAKFGFSRTICGYHLHHDRSFTKNRFLSWLGNLERFTKKHCDPAVQLFSLFSPVFDPDIQANYFDVFDSFENKPPPQRDAKLYDLTQVKGDVIEWLQQKLQEHQRENMGMILLDDDSRTPYEIYLPFLQSELIDAYLPKADWGIVKEEFHQRYANAGKSILNNTQVCFA